MMTARTKVNCRVFGSLEIWFTYVSPDVRVVLRCQEKVDSSPMAFCHTFGQDSGNIRNYKGQVLNKFRRASGKRIIIFQTRPYTRTFSKSAHGLPFVRILCAGVV